ncbi:Uncharacterised protein [Bordetella pertussis]|nr:Uncharacterised protein [Bordetella pertussis]
MGQRRFGDALQHGAARAFPAGRQRAHHGQAQRVAERVQHVFQADLPAFRVVGKHPGSLFHSTRIYKPTRSRGCADFNCSIVLVLL